MPVGSWRQSRRRAVGAWRLKGVWDEKVRMEETLQTLMVEQPRAIAAADG